MRMGKLRNSHLVEGGIWVTIIVIFFSFSFEFNQPIEIYKFGATGWPRVILGILFFVTLGNIYHQYNYGSAIQKGRVGIADEYNEEGDKSTGTLFKIIAVLFTPFLYALSLKPAGFYFTTPFFILAIILLFGERRPRWIISITLLIYALLLSLFMVVLNAPLPQGNMSPFYDYSAFILRMNTQFQQLDLW